MNKPRRRKSTKAASGEREPESDRSEEGGDKGVRRGEGRREEKRTGQERRRGDRRGKGRRGVERR